MTAPTWKQRTEGKLPADLAAEIDIFESQIEARKTGKIDEKVFAETRLRRGTYGQRYDNGQRHDGSQTRTIPYPAQPTKGPDTQWHAPGMQRIKLPMGRLSARQLEVLAELAEEYSDAIIHITTRQDVQLHFVHIEDTPALMRRLAEVGITTREACGNSVRNVTACQFAGVCQTQAFDVTPYAHATTYHLLGHKDTQDFGRKFKIAFSGCREKACALTAIHDIGCIAAVREIDGKTVRGFELYVGGGLGAVPHKAQLLYDFVTEEELLPTCQALCLIFARLGERKNRARARFKFVVQKLGIDEVRRLTAEQKQKLPHEDAWTSYLSDLGRTDDAPLHDGVALPASDLENCSAKFLAWKKTNVQPQPQAGYMVATIRFPLGDITSHQGRALADLARRYVGDSMRTTVEQNLVFRWLPEAALPAFFADLEAIGLADAGASTISDVVACPGTDTCKLGISASRGLAQKLEQHFGQQNGALHPDVKKLHIKASGCFNSCGQHHVSDIGFLGVSRNVGGRRVAHFQLVVGGEWENNGGSYGLAIGAFPSKRIPEVATRLTEHWIAEREPGERLQSFIKRTGRAKIKAVLEDLRHVPAYDDDPSFYRDWGDAREYTIGDMGVGECAGEVVSPTEFGLAASEREVFEAQLHLEQGNAERAATLAYGAMLSAAKALVQAEVSGPSLDDPDSLVSEFRARFYDTELFFDPFAGPKFAHYFFHAHESPPTGESPDGVHRAIEEAQLFIEAAHSCYGRLQEQRAQAR